MPSSWDSIWYNANVATMLPDVQAYGLLRDGAVCVRQGLIGWIGPTAALPAGSLTETQNKKNCGGRLVTPGLVDCHTHLVYAGNRAGEFELRLNGASYAEISRSGGGINATVLATRSASVDELYEQSAPRLEALLANGVTTIEIKSGYGLDTATELKMLRVAKRLARNKPVDIITTFLGAHAIPVEYQGRSDEYIDLVCGEMLPRIAEEELADAVDAFCEGIAFSPDQVERVFITAADLGLKIKCHAEQLSNLHGAACDRRRFRKKMMPAVDPTIRYDFPRSRRF